MALLFTVLVTFFVLVTAEDYSGLVMAYRKCVLPHIAMMLHIC